MTYYESAKGATITQAVILRESRYRILLSFANYLANADPDLPNEIGEEFEKGIYELFINWLSSTH